MPKKSLIYVLVIFLAVLLMLPPVSDAGKQRGTIRVIGPDDESKPFPSCPQIPGRMNRGKFRPSPIDATSWIQPEWEAGTLLLRGIISDVNEGSIGIIEGALTVDISEAEIEYRPFFHHFQIHNATDEEEVDETIEIQTGQPVLIQATIVETDNGKLLKASKVRVMDGESNLLDSDEGGIRGLLDSFDPENRLAVIEGIPVLIDGATVIRSRLAGIEDIAPGDLAGAHVVFIDTDADEIADSFYAEKLIVHTIQNESDFSGNDE